MNEAYLNSYGIYAVNNALSCQAGDHVARMAHFGLDCVKAAAETLVDADNPSTGTVQIRAGFHTGPVVANVFGTKYRQDSYRIIYGPTHP